MPKSITVPPPITRLIGTSGPIYNYLITQPQAIIDDTINVLLLGIYNLSDASGISYSTLIQLDSSNNPIHPEYYQFIISILLRQRLLLMHHMC